MKGIMATLLTLGLAGMASGQQSQNNPNNFGNPASGVRSITDSGGRGFNNTANNAGGGNDASGANAFRLGPLDMPFDDELIAKFQRAGVLSSDIKPEYRDAVNEIVFFYEDANGNRKQGSTFGLEDPVEKNQQSGTLVFQLDSYDIERIRNGGIHYKYDPSERGIYSTVLVYFVDPTAQKTAGRDTAVQNQDLRRDSARLNASQNNRFASNNYDNNAALQTSQYPRGSTADVSARDDYLNFMGPPNPYPQNLKSDQTAQANYPQSPNMNSHSTFDSNPNRWAPTANAGNQVSSLLRNSGNDFGVNSGTDPNLIRRQNTGAMANDIRSIAPNPNFSPVVPRSMYNDPNNSGYQVNNQANNQTTNREPSGSNNTGLIELERLQQEIAERRAQELKRKLYLENAAVEDLKYQNDLKQQDHDLLHQQLEDEQRSMLAERQRREYNSLNANDQNFSRGNVVDGSGGNPYTPVRRGNYGESLINSYQQTPSRLASNNLSPQLTSNGVRDLATAIPGPSNEREPTNGNGGKIENRSLFNQSGVLGDPGNGGVNPNLSMEGPMFFMLLCSLALNIYLGWISRGFYVRYNELADELRETFTATM